MLKYLMLIPILLFLGCADKSITINSLSPSKIKTQNINKIIIEKFENDDINFTDYLENRVINQKVDRKKVFSLQPSYRSADAILTGRVLDRSMGYNIYFEEETDYKVCLRYEVNHRKDKKKRKCIEYRIKRYPCESFNYSTNIKVQVLDKREKILFSEIYNEKEYFNRCYEDIAHRPNYIYLNSLYRPSEDFRVYNKLAKRVASRVVRDISPHYKYQRVFLIEELKSSEYEESVVNDYELINELVEYRYFNDAQTKLNELNKRLNFNSYEIYYTLALTYEAQNSLEKAKNLYIEAKNLCNNLDDLKLINNAINRTKLNLVNKINAKSQLIDK